MSKSTLTPNNWSADMERFILTREGIKLETNLLKNGFEDLPSFDEKEVIFTPECVTFPHLWESYKEMLTEQSKQSDIAVKFGEVNSAAVATNLGSADGSWNYLWYPTHSSVVVMKMAMQGSCLGRDALSIVQSLLFHVGNNHPLSNLMCPDMPLLKPDCAAGPFYYNEASQSVCSAIDTPDLRATAELLQLFHVIAQEHLGTTVLPLPIFIGEHKKEDASEYSDGVSKLLAEMRYAREMMELVWENAPEFNFGYFVGDREWRIYAMKRDTNGQLLDTLLFQHKATSYLDRAYIVTVLNRLAVYIHHLLLGVKMVSHKRRLDIINQLLDVVKRRKAAMAEKQALPRSTNTNSSRSKRSTKSAEISSPVKAVKSASKENQPSNKPSGYNAKQCSVVEDIADNVQVVSCNNQLFARKTGPRDRIKLEAKRLQALKGPYVAPLMWLDKGDNYFAMATPLYDEVPQPTSVKETVRLSKQLLTALSSLHEASYLHGDVKLNNIVYDTECQRVRFIDFETARRFVPGQKAEFYCGTKLFMAPEMLRREPISEKSDVFSMGLVLASLIYDRKIANHQDRADMLSDVISLRSSPLAPTSLIELVRQMLQENSAQRITAADALSECQKIEASLNQRKVPTKVIVKASFQALSPASGVSQTKQANALDKENLVPNALVPVVVVQRTPGLSVRK